MIGTIRWNLVVASAAMIITFLFSIANNVFNTSLFRSFYSFAILFLLIFLVRWLLGTVANLKTLFQQTGEYTSTQEEHLGQHINISTPEEIESIQEMMKEHGGTQPFSPLEPPRLVSKEKLDPEELAKALRHLSED